MNMLVVRSLALAALLLSACGPSNNEAKAPRASKYKGVHAYYPFEVGMQWTFMVRLPGAPMGILKVDKVIAFDGKLAIVQDSTSSRSYSIGPNGITREPSHAPLLKWPIVLGDKWPGAEGATVEVTKVDAKVTVEAGTFEGCVETTERVGGDAASILITTFCPDVGPVMIDIAALNQAPGEPPAQHIAKLRAFGPAITLPPKDKP
jgi:hypothetical protein